MLTDSLATQIPDVHHAPSGHAKRFKVFLSRLSRMVTLFEIRLVEKPKKA
jgi:hypothetical protein